jgi:hypothetical protein
MGTFRQEDSANFIFIQDGAPSHWHMEVRNYLDQNLPRRWSVKFIKPLVMYSNIFWDVTLCSLAEFHQCFEGIYCLHLQCCYVKQATSKM